MDDEEIAEDNSIFTTAHITALGSIPELATASALTAPARASTQPPPANTEEEDLPKWQWEAFCACGIEHKSRNALFRHLRDPVSTCYDHNRPNFPLPPARTKPRGGAKRRRAGAANELAEQAATASAATRNAADAIVKFVYRSSTGIPPPHTPTRRPKPPHQPRPPHPNSTNRVWLRPPLPTLMPGTPSMLPYGMVPPPTPPPPLTPKHAEPAPSAARAPH